MNPPYPSRIVANLDTLPIGFQLSTSMRAEHNENPHSLDDSLQIEARWFTLGFQSGNVDFLTNVKLLGKIEECSRLRNIPASFSLRISAAILKAQNDAIDRTQEFENP
jgi:hypothetical protein